MAEKLMRAVQYDRYGGGGASLEFVEIPIPSPNKGQLLLKVEATSLNPADWKIQKGMLRPFLPRRFPFTPGTDVAGEVVAIGSDVEGFVAGDKVIAFLGFGVGGGLAEYAVAEAKYTVLRPAAISPETAAGIPMAALTAVHALRSLNLDPIAGDSPANVLITAASGGVGTYAVQLAKLRNCHVTATCGTRNLDMVKALGADEVLDYKTPAGAALLSPSGKKYDAVVNCAPGIPWSTLKCNLVDGGRVADVAPPTFADIISAVLHKVGFRNKRRFILFSTPNAVDLKYAVDLLEKSQLKTVVDSSFPFDRAAEAFEKVLEGHASGKIIVNISVGHVASPR